MKPFDLYMFICSMTKEQCNKKKLPFFLMRSKLALENLHKRGWEDEQIKVLVFNTITALTNKGAPLSYQYIISILCTTTKSPEVKSVEEYSTGYESWIEQEKKRVGNVK